MNLTKQVHVYSLDTASFYNEFEMFIHRKLLRLYSLRNKIKNKTKTNRQGKKSLYESQYRRVNKLLDYFKEKLVEEFDRTREENNKSNKIRQLRPECLVGRNVVSVFESFLTRTLQCKVNELTEDIMIIQVYFFQIAEDLIKNGFMYKNEKYVLFSASAGQIRTKKFVVIKEDLLKKYQKTLMCGLTIEDINNKGGINVNY